MNAKKTHFSPSLFKSYPWWALDGEKKPQVQVQVQGICGFVGSGDTAARARHAARGVRFARVGTDTVLSTHRAQVHRWEDGELLWRPAGGLGGDQCPTLLEHEAWQGGRAPGPALVARGICRCGVQACLGLAVGAVAPAAAASAVPSAPAVTSAVQAATAPPTAVAAVSAVAAVMRVTGGVLLDPGEHRCVGMHWSAARWLHAPCPDIDRPKEGSSGLRLEEPAQVAFAEDPSDGLVRWGYAH